ncbi:acyl carrier protein [Gymnopus androsaceus JB14]|uniref:Acyl carrier protein n=1 Tax=Gymnopus androsaceus JB14 TaxID=1447944 RepID=A0A6A4IFD0_9AGAR|nr:acyl carrier protein [Gymnopus androsaceus JB14]
MSLFRIAARSSALPRLAVAASQRTNQRLSFRSFSAAAGLSKSEIELRVLDVLKGFEKVDASKLTTAASFVKDLGLDSLDAVELVMAVEEEFAIEIPDAEADEIQTVQQAIDYVAKTPEGWLCSFIFLHELISSKLINYGKSRNVFVQSTNPVCLRKNIELRMRFGPGEL